MNNFESNFNDFYEGEDSSNFIKELYKYLFYWKFFVVSVLILLSLAYLINRYTPKIYDTNAKIQILDKKQNNLEMPSAEDLFSSSKINLENEIEIIKSSPILLEVIKNKNLNVQVEAVGEIMTSKLLNYPFKIKTIIPSQSINNHSYNLQLNENSLLITNVLKSKNYLFEVIENTIIKHDDLPFEISNINKLEWDEDSYNINLISNDNLVESFKNDIKVLQVGKKSDVIYLNYQNSSPEFARNVLNEIIDVFNNDGIKDRQLIHKRTIDFVNERYEFLFSELESIESEKQNFKASNNLVDLTLNSNFSIKESIISDENLFINENQIFLVKNLLEELQEIDFELLPSNIGIENIEVNSLIASYNDIVLEKQKIITSAGPNNPYVKQLNLSINDLRKNIIFSLKSYLNQLNLFNEKLLSKSNLTQNNVSKIPSQEKYLRSIERNQQIKEALYLYLLQKGEEAQVSFAVTEPSIKVIEYGVSDKNPVSPNSTFIYLGCFLIGIFIPFIIIYFIFLFDNKVHSREDLEKYSLNILGEIPFFDLADSEKVFKNPDDRSIISESFRMLMSNVRYLQNNDSSSNVILVTSSIKGEGKTLNALNLALSFSSVGKKVLLIGCDLRNPQLHKYVNSDKNVAGIVDFLVDNKTNWKESVINPFENQPLLDILLSGPLPPNPLNLLNNGNIDILLKDAGKAYDHIIIDSAPTLLVADTQSIIKKSDILIFITRCNVTDNNVLSHIKKINDESNTNLGVILNGVGQKNSYGYSYGYKYGYGYSYKYSYNYGYGYGYSADKEK